MQKKEVISVVITTYNREVAILSQAIESVLNQTYAKVEIVLVDDNGKGTDYQLKNEATFGNHPRIQYIVNKKNSGAQVSRNKGILKSTGDFIAFLDDDDWWGLEKLEKQMCLFTSDEIGMVFCNGYIVDEDSSEEHKLYHDFHQNPQYNKRIDYKMMLAGDCVGSTSQVLIKKECFTQAGIFDVDMPARQDYEMWIRLSKYYDFYSTSEPLFYHRMHSGEQISRNSKKVLVGYKNILNKYKKDFAKDHNAKAGMILRIARMYFVNGSIINGITHSLWALVVSPNQFFYKLKNNTLFKIGDSK